jgi:hypothetical protein
MNSAQLTQIVPDHRGFLQAQPLRRFFVHSELNCHGNRVLGSRFGLESVAPWPISRPQVRVNKAEGVR